MHPTLLLALCYGCSLTPRGIAAYPPNGVSLPFGGSELRRIHLPRTSVNKVAGGHFLWENVWRGNNGGWIQWLASARRRPMPRGCSSARTPCRPRQTVSSSSSNFRRCWDEPDALSGWAAQCPG